MTHPAPEDLSRVPLFAGLSPGQLERLARHVECEHVRPGQVLVREGSTGYAFYVLRDGEAEVRHDASVVSTLRRHDFFGEVALLGDGQRQASVVATEPGTLWCLYGTTFRVLEAEHPEIAEAVASAAASRMAGV
jgi:cAMP-dependent protein kinase regulator